MALLPADELLAAETAIAELAAVTTDRLRGRPTGLSCLSCHGTMVELDGAPSPRYRCRVGHAWSPESLLAAQSDAVDAALWTALRALFPADRHHLRDALRHHCLQGAEPSENVQLPDPAVGWSVRCDLLLVPPYCVGR